MPKDLESWLSTHGLDRGATRTPISGGCISQAWHIKTSSGEQVFVKYRDEVPSCFYESEAEGLEYLRVVANLTVPEVLGYGSHFIALNYIDPGHQHRDFWERLACELGFLHQITRQQHGFINRNYCGLTIQENKFQECGYRFFGDQRVLRLADMAYRKNLLELQDYFRLEKLCEKLPDYIPEQPASLLHGDLWSGNIHVSKLGSPVFIDPAIYYGWAEIDIAMTQLFGGFPVRFYDAYCEVNPLEAGWQSRLELYNLYPLLNHLNLFGEGYLPEVKAILNKYV